MESAAHEVSCYAIKWDTHFSKKRFWSREHGDISGVVESGLCSHMIVDRIWNTVKEMNELYQSAQFIDCSYSYWFYGFAKEQTHPVVVARWRQSWLSTFAG